MKQLFLVNSEGGSIWGCLFVVNVCRIAQKKSPGWVSSKCGGRMRNEPQQTPSKQRADLDKGMGLHFNLRGLLGLGRDLPNFSMLVWTWPPRSMDEKANRGSVRYLAGGTHTRSRAGLDHKLDLARISERAELQNTPISDLSSSFKSP